MEETETERLVCVCVCVCVIVFIWWVLKFALVPFVMALFFCTLSQPQSPFTFQHAEEHKRQPIGLYSSKKSCFRFKSSRLSEIKIKTHTSPVRQELKTVKKTRNGSGPEVK